MLIVICTDRIQEFTPIVSVFRETSAFHFTENVESVLQSDPCPDVLVADPHIMERSGRSLSTLIRNASQHKIRVMVADPHCPGSLLRELRRMGLDTEEKEREAYDTKENPSEQKSKSEGFFSKKIAVTGLCHSAGAGFLTMLLAEEAAAETAGKDGLVTVLSCADSYLYHALGLKERFSGKAFRSVKSYAGDRNYYDLMKTNTDEGICWLAASGADDWIRDVHTIQDILQSIPRGYVFCDAGIPMSLDASAWIRECCDAVIAVINPLPSALMQSDDVLHSLKACGVPVIYVINRHNEGIDTQSVMDYLSITEAVFLPFADPAETARCEFAQKNPYRSESIRRIVMDPVCRILQQVRSLTDTESILFP